jgi:hypothetical protein
MISCCNMKQKRLTAAGFCNLYPVHGVERRETLSELAASIVSTIFRTAPTTKARARRRKRLLNEIRKILVSYSSKPFAPLQLRVLDALSKREPRARQPLTGQQLADLLDVGRESLMKHALTPLRVRGWVVNDRPGYRLGRFAAAWMQERKAHETRTTPADDNSSPPPPPFSVK